MGMRLQAAAAAGGAAAAAENFRKKVSQKLQQTLLYFTSEKYTSLYMGLRPPNIYPSQESYIVTEILVIGFPMCFAAKPRTDAPV
jgi:hypothetical protein